MPNLPVAREAIDAYGLDSVCQNISNRMSLTAIAGEVGVSIGSLLTWIEAEPERSARVRETRAATARLWDELAEDEIRTASDDMSLKKAKELAHHYRWRAAKIAPREYGDRQVLAGDPEAPLTGMSEEALDAAISAKLAAMNGSEGG